MGKEAVGAPHRRQPELLSPARRTTGQVVDAIAVALIDTELTIDELSDAVIDGTGRWAG
jgi:hypothetical protein